MKTLAKMLIISVVCIAVTVSYIDAYYSSIDADGQGFVSDWAYNPQWTAIVSVYAAESTVQNWLGISYVVKYESASVSTAEENSNGETNRGAYFLNIGNPFIDGPKNGNYDGDEYVDLSEFMDTWNSSPHGVSSWASASVVPDDDWDAGPIRVDM